MQFICFNCVLLQWLEEDFLGYLTEWESAVKDSGHTASERRKITLSEETLDGIKITGK